MNEADIKRAKQRGGCLSPLIIILDSGANLNIFSNANLLEQIKRIPSLTKHIQGAAGLFHCDILGRLTFNPGDLQLPDSHYYYSPDSMINIISLAILLKRHQIYMDTNLDNTFYLFDEKGRYLHFYNCPITNLYRLNIKEAESKEVVMIMITTEGRKEEYSSLDCTRARKLRELQHVLACPSDNDLANAIENNVIGHN